MTTCARTRINRVTVAVVAVSSVALAACANREEIRQSEFPTQQAQAQIVNSRGNLIGVAQFSQFGSGINLAVDVRGGLPAATYAIHIHETGRCDAPAFESAGSHWNPKSRRHGSLNARGPHAGDIPNVRTPTGSNGFVYLIRSARLATGRFPMLDQDGAAIVLHARPDDYRTDPSGNSGEPIACGVIEPIDR